MTDTPSSGSAKTPAGAAPPRAVGIGGRVRAGSTARMRALSRKTSVVFRLPSLLERRQALRDQLMLGVAAVSEFGLGIDTYLAHQESGTIVAREWIPIVFGPIAGTLLLLAGALAWRKRSWAVVVATVTLVASVAIGVLGTWYHIHRALIEGAPSGEGIGLDLLVYAPPMLGPMAFALIGWLGLSAAWPEDRPNSGRLRLSKRLLIQLPYSKSRAYYYIVAIGTLIALISSSLDHARIGFDGSNVWVWVPLGVGVFATMAALALGTLEKPSGWDYRVYVAAMLALLIIGPLGAWHHIGANLTSRGVAVDERFLKGVPVLAPMLFAQMGMLGLLSLVGARAPQRSRRA